MKFIKSGLLFSALLYFLLLSFFAFRPFRFIPGIKYAPQHVVFKDDGVRLAEGASLEFPVTKSSLNSFRNGAGFSLETRVSTDQLNQSGPARIITWSRSPMGRNFTLGQDNGNLVFRIVTSESEHNAQYHELVARDVLVPGKDLHVCAVFDGGATLFYLNGRKLPELLPVKGDLSVWSGEHVLALGDEPNGGRAWSGTIGHFNLFNRSLSSEEVLQLFNGETLVSLIGYDFTAEMGAGVQEEINWKALKYRNLFLSSDATVFQPRDCLLNILAFVPMALVLYSIWPAGLRERKRSAVFFLPVLFGMLVSSGIELTQRVIDGRVSCLLDLIYNTTGTLIGCIVLWGILEHRTALLIRRKKA